jgi:hypothetical protein
MCMHTDGEHCAALLCSVPAGDAGVDGIYDPALLSSSR